MLKYKNKSTLLNIADLFCTKKIYLFTPVCFADKPLICKYENDVQLEECPDPSPSGDITHHSVGTKCDVCAVQRIAGDKCNYNCMIRQFCNRYTMRPDNECPPGCYITAIDIVCFCNEDRCNNIAFLIDNGNYPFSSL